MSAQKRPLPFILRLFLWLILAAAVLYGLLIGYVWIREKSVKSSVTLDDAYDAIIILGAQVQPDGTPSVQLAWRLDAAAQAYEIRQVPIIVCGAQGKDESMTEAEAMKRYLAEKGIPEGDILTDPDSFNTEQNLKNAAALLQSRPEVRRVLVVSSDYHVPRAMALAGDLGFAAIGLGSPCKPEYWIKNHAREALAWCKYWGKKYLHLPLE